MKRKRQKFSAGENSVAYIYGDTHTGARPMDIESLKDVLGDEKFAALKTYVDDLTGQRDAARNESITGRKGLKAKLDEMTAAQARMLEKLGVESLEDLDALPDAKGQADAVKQYEAKLKKLERENAELAAGRQEIDGKYRDSLKRAVVADALGSHEFVARDLVETYVSQRLTCEGDELLFKDGDKLVAVKDGVAGLVKSRPELLKPTGTGGAGVRDHNAGGGGPAKGNFGGDRNERAAAIAARFPDLPRK